MYKRMNGLYPVNLRYITRSELSYYSRRNQLDLDIPRKNLEFSKRTVFHPGAELRNDIPAQIRNSSTINMFNRKFTEFLENQQFP